MNSAHLRVLFLAFPFPPNRAVGAVRSAKLAKYLALLGWQVTVVTIDPSLLVDPDPEFPDLSAIWCRELNIQRVLTGFDYPMLYGAVKVKRWWEKSFKIRQLSKQFIRWTNIDPCIGWNRHALKACERFQPGDVDVILVSGSPFSAFKTALQIGERLKVGVVLDYRDLWTMNPHAKKNIPNWIVENEAKVLQQASGVFVVSSSMERCIVNKFGHHEKISVITNGYDPDDFQSILPTKFCQPTVVYAGSFYPPLRVINPLITMISQVNRSASTAEKEVRLLYLGHASNHVIAVAKEMNASKWVDIGGYTTRRNVLASLKGSLVACVITSIRNELSSEVDSILTGKLFEAMGSGAPILLIAPKNCDAAFIVEQTNSGRSFTGSEIQKMSEWLAELVSGSTVSPKTDTRAYSWPEIIWKADFALRQVIRKRLI